MFLDKVHQKLDREQRDDKRDGGSEQENENFRSAQDASADKKFQHFETACSDHYGDGEEEGKFRGCGAGHSDEQSAQNRCARTGSSRNEREYLKRSDDNGGLVVDILCGLNPKFPFFVAVFYDDKGDTVDNQHERDDERSMQIFFENVVQGNPDDCDGKTGDEDFAPKGENILLHDGFFPETERKQFFPKEHYDG